MDIVQQLQNNKTTILYALIILLIFRTVKNNLILIAGISFLIYQMYGQNILSMLGYNQNVPTLDPLRDMLKVF